MAKVARTKFNKKIVKRFTTVVCNESIKIFVLDNGDYYDIHRITDKYAKDELNTLHFQEPKINVLNPKTYFDKGYMVAQAMEYIIWDRFYDLGIATIDLKITFEPH